MPCPFDQAEDWRAVPAIRLAAGTGAHESSLSCWARLAPSARPTGPSEVLVGRAKAHAVPFRSSRGLARRARHQTGGGHGRARIVAVMLGAARALCPPYGTE